jgi:ankyrin repeat protein
MKMLKKYAVWIAALVSVAGLEAASTTIRLTDAVKQGNRETVRALLKQRVDVNAAESDGMTALHWAVRASDVETAQLLIRAGANVKAANRYGITPLSLAATNGDAALIEALIKAGADPNTALPDGETVLMTAARTGNPAALKMLLVNGANVHAKENSQGQTALMWAAAENNPGAVQVLVESGADINARSTSLTYPQFKWVVSGMVSTSLPRGGWTPLMYAARQNATDAARALADSKADLNLRDPEGATALVIAIINAHFDLAAMLLEKGADPNVADQTGMAALYAAVDMHTLGPMLSRPVPKLVDKLDAADLVKILLARGANPNARLKRPVLGRHHDGGDASLGDGTTPLMRAAKANDVPVLRMLLEGGADPFLTQKDYTNALMIAAAGGGRVGAYASPFPVSEAGAIEAIKVLMEYGADVNAFNANGQTALHSAAQRGADNLVKFLAERGAKLDLKNKQGLTPLDVAMGLGGRGGFRAGRPPVGIQVRESTAALLKQLMAERTASISVPTPVKQ